MFFLLAISATFAYALQNTLLTQAYRDMDQLSAVAYRGLTLGISFLPLLLLAENVSLDATLKTLPMILTAALFGTVANLFNAYAFAYLTVGVASALTMSATAIMVAVIGFCFLGESLSLVQLLLIALVLGGVISLGASRSKGPLPKAYNMPKGMLYAALTGVFMSVAVVLLGLSSRQGNPIVTGYILELTCGVLAALLASARNFAGRPGLQRVTPRYFFKLLVWASPTAVGTTCYALALSSGSMAVAAAILSTMMVFSAFLGILIYREYPSAKQWAIISVVCAGVVGMKLFAG